MERRCDMLARAGKFLILGLLIVAGCSDLGDPVVAPLPTLSVVGDTLIEGAMGECEVRLSFEAGRPVTFSYVLTAATATVDIDFTVASGTLAIEDGEDHARIPVVSNQDSDIEPPESFRLTISDVVNAEIESDQAECVILDDDGLPILSLADGSAIEGQTLSFAVVLNKAGIDPVAFTYAALQGSATSGSDYTAVSRTDTISAGATSATINIATTDDDLSEGTELFTLTISAVIGAMLFDSTAGATILDNEPAPMSFANDIQPILNSRCIGCHAGPGAQHGFKADSYSNVMNTGDHAPQVVPFNSLLSRLYLIVTPTPPSGFPRMPQGGALSQGEIQKIKDWIDQGVLNN